jgi:hypothetical protein
MPYIRPEARASARPDTSDVGGLTYLLYKLCLDALPEAPRYRDFHAVVGALEAAKLEFYRRHVVPYEDVKIRENGDVAKG